MQVVVTPYNGSCDSLIVEGIFVKCSDKNGVKNKSAWV